jgi:hypothetical protein
MEGSGRRPPQGRPSHPQPTCMDVIVSEPFRTLRETAPPARLSPSFFIGSPPVGSRPAPPVPSPSPPTHP